MRMSLNLLGLGIALTIHLYSHLSQKLNQRNQIKIINYIFCILRTFTIININILLFQINLIVKMSLIAKLKEMTQQRWNLLDA